MCGYTSGDSVPAPGPWRALWCAPGDKWLLPRGQTSLPWLGWGEAVGCSHPISREAATQKSKRCRWAGGAEQTPGERQQACGPRGPEGRGCSGRDREQIRSVGWGPPALARGACAPRTGQSCAPSAEGRERGVHHTRRRQRRPRRGGRARVREMDAGGHSAGRLGPGVPGAGSSWSSESSALGCARGPAGEGHGEAAAQ